MQWCSACDTTDPYEWTPCLIPYIHYLSAQVKTDDLKNVLNTQMYSPQDGNAHLGRFTVDPKYTDFIGEFLEKREVVL